MFGENFYYLFDMIKRSFKNNFTNFMKKNNFSFGFTLIELLVVIAIVGIFAAVVTASVSSQRNKALRAAFRSEVDGLTPALIAKCDSGSTLSSADFPSNATTYAFNEDTILLNCSGPETNFAVNLTATNGAVGSDGTTACTADIGLTGVSFPVPGC